MISIHKKYQLKASYANQFSVKRQSLQTSTNCCAFVIEEKHGSNKRIVSCNFDYFDLLLND